jgi:hypothetical protein
MSENGALSGVGPDSAVLLEAAGIDLEDLDRRLHSFRAMGPMFLVGSLALGLGNGRSDVDVLVLADAEGSLAADRLILKESATILAVEALRGGQKLQVEIIDRGRLEAIQAKAALFVSEEREMAARSLPRPTVGVLPFEELRLLQRLHAGSPLIGKGVAEGTWEEISREDFAHYVALVHNLDILNALEDLLGFMEEPDSSDPLAELPTLAALKHRIIMQLGGMLLASVHRPYIGEKFLFRLLVQSRANFQGSIIDRLIGAYISPICSRSDLMEMFPLFDECVDIAEKRVPILSAWYRIRGRTPVRADGSWRRGRVGVSGVR